MIDAIDDLLDPLYARLGARDQLRADERRELRAIAGPIRTFMAGTDMVTEGARVTRSTLMVSGYSIRYRMLAGGERQITAIHIPGDFVDLHSFLLKTMDHSVGALSACSVVFYDHKDLEAVTRRHPHLTRMLWLSTLLDGAVHREWIVGMGRLSAFARLAHLICELYVRLNVTRQTSSAHFDLPITQMELADTLGISAVHVNRVLQEMRDKALVSWKGSHIEILDWQKLVDAAEFDPTYLHLNQEPR